VDDHLGVFLSVDSLPKPAVDALEIERLDDSILPVLFNLLVLQPARFDQWQRDYPGDAADLRSFCGVARRKRRAGGDFACLCHDQTARGSSYPALHFGVDAFSRSMADHALAVDHGWTAVCQCSLILARLAVAEFARSAALFELQPAWDARSRLRYLVTSNRENSRVAVKWFVDSALVCRMEIHMEQGIPLVLVDWQPDPGRQPVDRDPDLLPQSGPF